MITGTNSSRIHASLPPAEITSAAVNRKMKNCCRNSASTLDIANCTLSMSLMIAETSVPVGCFWKNAAERRSTLP